MKIISSLILVLSSSSLNSLTFTVENATGMDNYRKSYFVPGKRPVIQASGEPYTGTYEDDFKNIRFRVVGEEVHENPDTAIDFLNGYSHVIAKIVSPLTNGQTSQPSKVGWPLSMGPKLDKIGIYVTCDANQYQNGIKEEEVSIHLYGKTIEIPEAYRDAIENINIKFTGMDESGTPQFKVYFDDPYEEVLGKLKTISFKYIRRTPLSSASEAPSI